MPNLILKKKLKDHPEYLSMLAIAKKIESRYSHFGLLARVGKYIELKGDGLSNHYPCILVNKKYGLTNIQLIRTWEAKHFGIESDFPVFSVESCPLFMQGKYYKPVISVEDWISVWDKLETINLDSQEVLDCLRLKPY